MCFSATASFGAGIVLSTIGTLSIKKAQNPSQILFACIPSIFAAQQFTEGFLWLALANNDYAPLQWPATYLFLFFAQVVWPFWVPYSIFRLEKNNGRKKILKILVLIGSLVSLYLAYCLMTYQVEAKIDGLHISYKQLYPLAPRRYGGILYIAATVIPPFFSSVKRMWSLGTAILISYVITTLFYKGYIVSVWCFFASIISIAVLAIVIELNKSPKYSVVQASIH